jgi:hypothetical protein
MRISLATSAITLAVLGSTIVLVGCGGAPLAAGGGDDAETASAVGIFATVNGEPHTFTSELQVPLNPVVLAADNLVRKESLIITVTDGATPHGTYACDGSSVAFQYWPPNDETPSAPYRADDAHGACTVTYDWTGEFYEGSFTGTLSPAAGGPTAFTMRGTFRLRY